MKVLGYVLVAALAANCSAETAGPNRAPVAVAGSDRVAVVDEIVTLNGSGSYDPDGDSLGYRWTLVAGPGAAELSAERAVSVRLTPDVMGVWVVRLGVLDGKLESEPDVVQVRVFGGSPCTIDADCDDGLYCNGQETCDVPSGCRPATNPCAETECNHCNETAGNCFDPAGTVCDDGEVCTVGDSCDGSGACRPGSGKKDSDSDTYIDEICPGGDDCDDGDADVNPGATEGPVCDADATCYDRKDNECDGDTDDSDGDCSATNFICVYGPATVPIGSTGSITVRLDGAGYDESRIVCYTDGSRLRAPTDLLFNDFESDFSGFTRSDTGRVLRRNDAQSPLSLGSWGVRICRDHWLMTIDPIDTTGRTRIRLRYGAMPQDLEDGEFLITEYSPDGGSSWYVLDVQGDGYHLDTFRWFTHILPPRCEGVTNLRIRFRVQGADHNNDCAYIDDFTVSDLPDPTVSWTLLANHFEPGEGNSAADNCDGETIVHFTLQGADDAKICLRGDAQNPATSGSQGVRIVDSDPSYLKDPEVDTRYVPSGSDLVSEFYMRALNLNQDQYASAWYHDGSEWFMMNGVGVNTRTEYDWFRFVWEPSGIGIDNARVDFFIPNEAGLGADNGIYVDDYEFTWYRAGHDVIGAFNDQGNGAYTADIQSDLAGTANITCIFYGTDPPLMTDGTGDNSGSAPVNFTP
jgi:hypothetical protein